jgi:DNA-binding HxlR family transcriptional regulator
VRELLSGSQRFAVLLRGIGEVSPRLLTALLRLLEAEAAARTPARPRQVHRLR